MDLSFSSSAVSFDPSEPSGLESKKHKKHHKSSKSKKKSKKKKSKRESSSESEPESDGEKKGTGNDNEEATGDLNEGEGRDLTEEAKAEEFRKMWKEKVVEDAVDKMVGPVPLPKIEVGSTTERE